MKRFLPFLVTLTILSVRTSGAQNIVVTPDSFDVAAGEGLSVTRTLSLSNNGADTLHWSLASSHVSSRISRPLPKTIASGAPFAPGPRNNASSIERRAFKAAPKLPRAMGGATVLIIGDNGSQTDVAAVLQAAGFGIEYVVDDAVYDGTNPAPDGYTAVVLLDGVDYGDNMPFTGQEALVNYVNNGGGLVFTEWIAYEYSSNRYTTFGQTLIPVYRTSGITSTETYSIIKTHPITEGLPMSFSVSGGSNIGTASSGTVLVQGTAAGDAVTLKEVGFGKVVQFAIASNYLGYHPFLIDEMQTLLVNAVNFVSSGVSWIATNPSEGAIPPGGQQSIDVTFDAGSLSTGSYHAQLEITSDDVDPADSLVVLPVRFNVLPPHMTLSADMFNVSVPAGGVDSVLLTIGNTGQGVLNWSAQMLYPDAHGGGGSFPTFELSPSFGSVSPSGASSVVKIRTLAPLDPGQFGFYLRLTTNDTGNFVVDLPFDVTILEADIDLPDTISITANPGDSAVSVLAVTNTGQGYLHWSALVSHNSSQRRISKSGTQSSGQTKARASEGPSTFKREAVKSGYSAWERRSRNGVQAPKTLLLASEGDTAYIREGVIDPLVATGLFSSTDFDIIDEPDTLILEELIPYNSILVWTDSDFPDAENVGDVLKQYVDAGGGVVLSTYGLSNNWAIAGGILDPGYSPFLPATQQSVSGTLDMSSITNTSHPIFAGIGYAPTYWSNSNYSNPPLNTGGVLLASDTDGNRLVAENANGKVVGIVVFPSNLDMGNFEAALMFANALYHVSGTPVGQFGWLSMSKYFGIVDPVNSDEVGLTVRPDTLAAGTYYASIMISSNDPDEANRVVVVKMDVQLDQTPPVVDINFFQDNHLTSQLDVVGIADESLATAPVFSVTLPNSSSSNLTVDTVDYANQVYYAHYQLGETGNYTFHVVATDRAGNQTNESRTLAVALAKPGSPSAVTSHDGKATLEWPADGLTYETYVTVHTTHDDHGAVYHFGPDGLDLRQPVEVSIDFSDILPGHNEQHFVIQRWSADGTTCIPTRIVQGQAKARVTIDRLGTYRVVYDPSVTSQFETEIPKTFALYQNFPNPFNPTTSIRFDLPSDGFVSLSVYNILGQEVRNLLDREIPAGVHHAVWDGRDDAGHMAASGIYFYRLKTGDALRVKKMLLIK